MKLDKISNVFKVTFYYSMELLNKIFSITIEFQRRSNKYTIYTFKYKTKFREILF